VKVIRSLGTTLVFVVFLALLLVVSIMLIKLLDRAIAVAAFAVASIGIIWRGLSLSKGPLLRLQFRAHLRLDRAVDYEVVLRNRGNPADQFNLELRLPKVHFAHFSRGFHTGQHVALSRLQPNANCWTLRQNPKSQEFVLAFNPLAGFRVEKEKVVAIIRADVDGCQEQFSVRYRIEAPKMRAVDREVVVAVPSAEDRG
jgi:hypothetical protein